MKYTILTFCTCMMLVMLFHRENEIGDFDQDVQQYYNELHEEYMAKFAPFDSLQQKCLSSILSQIRDIPINDTANIETNTNYFIDKMGTLREINTYLTDRQSFIASIEDHISLSKRQENVNGVLPAIGRQEDKDNDYVKGEAALFELENIVAYVEDATREFPVLQALVDRLTYMQTTILSEVYLVVKHNPFDPDYMRNDSDWRVALENLDHKIDQDTQRSRRRSRARHGGNGAEKIIAHGVIKYAEQQVKKVIRRVRKEESRVLGLHGKMHSKKLRYFPDILKFIQGLKKELHHIGKKFHTTPNQTRFHRAKRSVTMEVADLAENTHNRLDFNGSLMTNKTNNSTDYSRKLHHIGKKFDTTPKQTRFHRAKRSVMMEVADLAENTHNRLDFNGSLMTNKTNNSRDYSRKILNIRDAKKYTDTPYPYPYVTNFSTVDTFYSGVRTLDQFKKRSLKITKTYANVEFYSTPFRETYCVEVAVQYYPSDNPKMETTLRHSLCYDEGNISLRQVMVVMVASSIGIFFFALYCWSYAYVYKYVSDQSERLSGLAVEPTSCDHTGNAEACLSVTETENRVFSSHVEKDGDEPPEDSSPQDSTAVTLDC